MIANMRTHAYDRIGASVFRIVGGTAILLQYLTNYGQRHYLFGPEGAFPFATFREIANFPLYRLANTPAMFELLYHTGIVIAILWLLGWRTLWLTPLQFLFWRGLQERNVLLWDGGDNLMSILMLYATFADLSAHFSFDALRPAVQPGRLSILRAELHRGAMLAMALQVCLLYAVAGLTKARGPTWMDGTAVYYAFVDPEHGWGAITDWVIRQGYLVTVLSYLTVAFQIGFTFFVFLNETTRRWSACIGIFFHVGIILGMGLTTFGLLMIAADATFVRDADYRKAGALLSELASRTARRWQAKTLRTG